MRKEYEERFEVVIEHDHMGSVVISPFRSARSAISFCVEFYSYYEYAVAKMAINGNSVFDRSEHTPFNVSAIEQLGVMNDFLAECQSLSVDIGGCGDGHS